MTLSGNGISQRAQKALVPIFSYIEAAMQAMGPEAYNPETKKDGFICLAVAENVLNFDMLKAKLDSCNDMPIGTITYSGPGYVPFLQEVAKFMSRRMVHSHYVDAANLLVSSGCGAVLDNVFWALCDPGDAVIIPSPCYPAFKGDLTVRDKCHIVFTKVHPEYRITEEMLQEAYERGVREAGTVKALLLTNPNNPVGHIYTRSELNMMVQWASEHNVHIVSDEIYANSVFQPSKDCPFVSIADVADMTKGMTHVIWGFSKDFGMNGFRVGLLYSHNSLVLKGTSAINYFSQASSHTQHLLAHLLQDEAWTDSYLGQSNDNVLKSWKMLAAWMDKNGIAYYTPLAAQFCFMDLRRFLPERTWKGEARLFERLWKEGRVVVSPGSDCNMDTPGYFRCCFPSKTLDTLQVALERLERVLHQPW